MAIKYFARANTCTGEVNYTKSNLSGCNKNYLIQSEFEYIKCVFISRLCAYIQEHCENTDIIYNPNIPNCYDGFVCHNKRISVTDSELMCTDNNSILVDIDSCINKKGYNKLLMQVCKINDEIKNKLECVYAIYDGAKKIHDEWESVYIKNMNFNMLNHYNNELIKKLVPDKSTGKHPVCCHRFFGSVYHNGNINFIDEITREINNKYYIKGRPGTGKSTFLKKLAAQLEQKGYSTDIYHCGFDSKSVDMVVSKELSICVFDSTSPHEKNPQQAEQILDFYTNSGLDGVDEKYNEKLADIQFRYNKQMSIAKLYFEEIFEMREDFNKVIAKNMDFEILNNIVYDLLYEII